MDFARVYICMESTGRTTRSSDQRPTSKGARHEAQSHGSTAASSTIIALHIHFLRIVDFLPCINFARIHCLDTIFLTPTDMLLAFTRRKKQHGDLMPCRQDKTGDTGGVEACGPLAGLGSAAARSHITSGVGAYDRTVSLVLH